MKSIEPGFDRVICKELDQETQTMGGILLPNGLRENTIKCVVTCLGPKASFKGDVDYIKHGDVIVISQYAGASFDFEGEKLKSVEYKDILAVISE